MDAIDFTGDSREYNDDSGWDGGIHGGSGFGSGTGAGMCTFCGTSSDGYPGIGWGDGSGNGSGCCSGGQ